MTTLIIIINVTNKTLQTHKRPTMTVLFFYFQANYNSLPVMAYCLICGEVNRRERNGRVACRCQRVSIPVERHRLQGTNIVACASEIRTTVEIGIFKYMAPHFTGSQVNTITNEVLHQAILAKGIISMTGELPVIRMLINGEQILKILKRLLKEKKKTIKSE